MSLTKLRDKRAVIFDLDGTLYLQKPVRRAMLLRLLRAHAVRPLVGYRTIRFLSAFRRAQEEMRTGVSGATADRQIQVACEQSGLHIDRGAALVARWMEEEPLDLLRTHRRDGLIQMLGALHCAGKRLALLSDYPANAKVEAMEIGQFFEVIVCAQDADVGVFKPSPRGIEVTLERLGIEAEQAVYIGDRPEVDYAAARAAGVDCAIFTSSSSLDSGFVQLRSCVQLQQLLV